MHKIVPHLWYDKEAKQAAEFYCSVFPRSKITHTSVLHDTPSGDCDVVNFEIMGQPLMAISAGPYFQFTPAISFMVNFDPSQDTNAETLIDDVWNKLLDGGTVMMPLQEYPFSKRFGWVQDKYGLSWQLILTNPEGEERPLVLPTLLFVGDAYGKAEEASNFYISTFKNAKRGALMHYGPGQEPNKEGTVMFSDFKLEDQWFVAMDGGGEHKFAFNEAISFIVHCDTQEEIDHFWSTLSAVPESEQCGWLKDKYGVSWQITPSVMEKMMSEGTEEQIRNVTQAFLQMKKFDIAKLEEAYGK